MNKVKILHVRASTAEAKIKKKGNEELTEFPSITTVITQYKCSHRFVGASCLHLEEMQICSEFQTVINCKYMYKISSLFTWLYEQSLCLHLPHLSKSVFVPWTVASCASSIDSLTKRLRKLFISSLAISY